MPGTPKPAFHLLNDGGASECRSRPPEQLHRSKNRAAENRFLADRERQERNCEKRKPADAGEQNQARPDAADENASL